MLKPKLVVMAAYGARTFSSSQREKLRRFANVQFVPATNRLSKNEFIKAFRVAAVAGLTPRGSPAMTPNLLTSLPNLKAIAIPTTGFDWLDVPLVAKHGIKVCHVPNFCSDSA